MADLCRSFGTFGVDGSTIKRNLVPGKGQRANKDKAAARRGHDQHGSRIAWKRSRKSLEGERNKKRADKRNRGGQINEVSRDKRKRNGFHDEKGRGTIGCSWRAEYGRLWIAHWAEVADPRGGGGRYEN